MTAIAEHLVNNDPELTILMISGSNALPAFDLPERIDYIKLPCLARDVRGTYDAKSLAIGLQPMIELRGNLILSAMLDFQPDMIVVDKKPFGVSNELQPVLDVLARRIRPPKMVLLLRDILDDPTTTRNIWERNGYHEAIETFYDAVLVVGDSSIYNLGTEYAFPASTLKRLRYCGYIRKSGTSSQLNTQTRQPLVLVTPGGGEDGERLLQTYIASLEEGSVEGYESLLFLGPDLADTKARELQRLALRCDRKNRPLTLRRFTKRMPHYMQMADVLVTMGGYNTVYEGLSMDKSMVVVPRTEPSKEQEIRADRLSRLGHIRSIHPEQLTPMTMAAAVNDSFEQRVNPVERIDFNGLGNVRRELTNIAAGAY